MSSSGNEVPTETPFAGPPSALRPLTRWDARLLRQLATADDVRAVFITDGNGRAVQWLAQSEPSAAAPLVVDVVMHALVTAGKALELGELEVVAQVYEAGLVVSARGATETLTVLAAPTAALGPLAAQLRSVLAASNQRGEAP